MDKEFTVPLSRIINELSLEVLYMPEDPENVLISRTDVNRPGLQLSGFFDYFDKDRIQIFGLTEITFLQHFVPEKRRVAISRLFEYRPPAVVISRNKDVFPEMLESARQYHVPVLRTAEPTSGFLSGLISFLNVQLAPRITRHGVLVEVYGEGILLLGESGVGKSETAIELVKRGHRLIADDAVEIRRVSSKTLVGTSPENIRHFVELRGIGIVNARRIFGMGSVKITEKVDMVIHLEVWNSNKIYDRMGMDNEKTEILGVKVPSLTIPVKPGRNLAIIIEVAAMNNRQKKMGYNAAQELLERLSMTEHGTDENTKKEVDWDAF
ncbi:HPr(Ser) kinase/phosphatase [Ethanoligenens harbinense]|uniref:HPr kinase/phosphorylase n=1 Tax=Ethanoligenens harbinense (strain DSM 18485 / JCM 12961 / CGMCC 1.5033 / YUAN-3) TaxID=663278 RepID=E6U6B2_ETHHY|nr:HPr(Ser) kinase/phosphatase [Ethanoligenens harbinense]ADU26879.1 HPr kinase [Ethanoligenens harbinense YUAN-3]AVQ95978.1 HPr(Ser) kinase/phosphatase [Ethanoligenens harbinense YUAN-3]AYF38640.1 HPr(Ser) kinase/phosphatase [Ethanoligenens harbinense]AYF41387.1 HPr(Ser) kinase/phosphatase [Ethanoligenens harbinense]QCN92220.1 HPr(Ser) kinase/phosphatase [Ethanoligenens harbinense]